MDIRPRKIIEVLKNNGGELRAVGGANLAPRMRTLLGINANNRTRFVLERLEAMAADGKIVLEREGMAITRIALPQVDDTAAANEEETEVSSPNRRRHNTTKAHDGQGRPLPHHLTDSMVGPVVVSQALPDDQRIIELVETAAAVVFSDTVCQLKGNRHRLSVLRACVKHALEAEYPDKPEIAGLLAGHVFSLLVSSNRVQRDDRPSDNNSGDPHYAINRPKEEPLSETAALDVALELAAGHKKRATELERQLADQAAAHEAELAKVRQSSLSLEEFDAITERLTSLTTTNAELRKELAAAAEAAKRVEAAHKAAVTRAKRAAETKEQTLREQLAAAETTNKELTTKLKEASNTSIDPARRARLRELMGDNK